MNGSLSDLTDAPANAGVNRLIVDRSFALAAIALVVGAISMLSPPLALMALAALAARLLLRGEALRVDLAGFAGPLAAALIVGAFVGLAGAVGVLFVWRLIADARWSVGEVQRLAAAAGRPSEATFKALAHAWMTPLYGLVLVAYTAPHMIAGFPLDLPHAPLWFVLASGALAAGAFLDWGLQRAADWRLGELATAPAAHLLIHHAIFLVAFGLTLDVSAGVVTMIAWRLAHAAPVRAAQTA